MDIKNLLQYNLMTSDHKQTKDAKAQFQARWKLLADIHQDMQARFIEKMLAKINGKDTLIITPHLEKIEALQAHITENIDTVESAILHQYAFNLKEVAILSIKMCKKYKVYDDIKSFKYNTDSKMIELNDEDLYFLGETKKQFEPSESSKIAQICTACDSNNLMKLSQLHEEQKTNPAYAPPKKRHPFFTAFLTCFFLGSWGYSLAGDTSEPLTLYMLVGFACLAYTVYAFHYNVMKFPSERKQWEQSSICHDCGATSLPKS